MTKLPTGMRYMIEAFASRERQVRAWFGGGPEVSSPGEDMCMLFDDQFVEDFTRSLPSADQSLKDALTLLLDKIATMEEAMNWGPTDYCDPAVLIDHPSWVAVRDAAARVLAADA